MVTGVYRIRRAGSVAVWLHVVPFNSHGPKWTTIAADALLWYDRAEASKAARLVGGHVEEMP